MRILGVDYGLKRIGLAISDGTIASPLGKISDLQGVIRVIEAQGVSQIVIGFPDRNNSNVQKFGSRLNQITGLPVEYWDESYSTKLARKAMINRGVPVVKRQQQIDQNAATVILQSYLDSDHGHQTL